MRASIGRIATLAFALVVSASALGQQPDAARILADVKAATGGAAWDALRSLHTRVKIKASGLEGSAERWASITTGRSVLSYELGPLTGMQGFDGLAVWSQDAKGDTRVESDDDTRELATNTAYRDRLAFWFPERQPARIEYARRDSADGIDYDVIRIAPEGGRPYEVWVGMLTRRIERLVENEGSRTRTEVYGDFRTVQGVTLPFRVRTTRGDAQHDEEYTIDTIEYNVALDDVDFGVPPPPAADVAFAPGKDAVDIPFVVRSGHVFVDVTMSGKGPFRMLFDAGGASVLMPAAAKALGVKPQRAGDGPNGVALATIDRVDIGGVALERQTFAVIDLASLMRRVEGADDIAGIIGYEVLKRLPAKIDYERGLLTLYRPRTFRASADAVRVPFQFDERVPQIRASIDGLAGVFDIDTGSRASVTLAAPFVDGNELVQKYSASREVIAGAGVSGHWHALLARAGKLSFAGVDVDKPVTYLSLAKEGALADSPIAGNIGYGVLRRFSVTFDYAHQALYFMRNAHFAEPDVHDRAGMWLERGERGFDVVEVVRDGPAGAAGLVAGDVIVAIGGKPVKSMALADARALMRGDAGTKIRLALARKSKGHGEVVITLRDLI